MTLPAPISATAILAEVAEDLVRAVLADHPSEKTISLLAISVSHLEKHQTCSWNSRSASHRRAAPRHRTGRARWLADRAVDWIRDRFGWEAVGYASVVLGASRSVPDGFRELAEKEL